MSTKTPEKHKNILTFQSEFRPALPVVHGSKDYREFRASLEEMDRLLVNTGIEKRVILAHVYKKDSDPSPKRFTFLYTNSQLAIRYSILLVLTGLSSRKLSCRVADSQLFQWFTHTANVDGIKPFSKSTIERYEKMFPNEELA